MLDVSHHKAVSLKEFVICSLQITEGRGTLIDESFSDGCLSLEGNGCFLFINATCWVPCHLVLSQLDVIDDAYIGIPIVGAACIAYIYV